MGEQERRFFHALCYAVGAEKALLQAVFRARIWRGKGCTRTQRLIQSQDKSSVQPYQTADCMFCGGSHYRLAAFLSAQRQHRHKPCVYGYDCRHAALFPVRHV